MESGRVGGVSGVGPLGTGCLFEDPLCPRGGNSRDFFSGGRGEVWEGWGCVGGGFPGDGVLVQRSLEPPRGKLSPFFSMLLHIWVGSGQVLRWLVGFVPSCCLGRCFVGCAARLLFAWCPSFCFGGGISSRNCHGRIREAVGGLREAACAVFGILQDKASIAAARVCIECVWNPQHFWLAWSPALAFCCPRVVGVHLRRRREPRFSQGAGSGKSGVECWLRVQGHLGGHAREPSPLRPLASVFPFGARGSLVSSRRALSGTPSPLTRGLRWKIGRSEIARFAWRLSWRRCQR